MSYKMNSSNCSLIEESSENTIVAKLRRLKIEEKLLVNNITKITQKETFDDDTELPVIYSSEFKNYTAKLKNRFTEIKNMFGDIKTVTEENLSSIDIENMKRDVIKLDDKIRTFKRYLQSELISTTSQEEELSKQINDVEEKEPKCTLKIKPRIKPFNHIVPSPVKVMIQSPFKSKEVQQFQEFMKSSHNRYGGWNEYHHNVFVHIWNKHFNSVEQIESHHESEFTVGNHDQLEAFIKETLQKISGSTYSDVVSHHNWYCQYLYLKKQQQNALNKWKMNKSKASGSQYEHNIMGENSSSEKPKPFHSNELKPLTNEETVEELLDSMETRTAEEIANALCDITLQEGDSSVDTKVNLEIRDNRASEYEMIIKQRSFSDVLKPTKQWTNRCKSSYKSVNGYNDIEIIQKLRVPDWRLTLQNGNN